VHYLSSRGNFSTMPFKVSRFVLMSSRDSVGGGPYVVEEAWPLMAVSRKNWSASAFDEARTIR